MTKAFPPSTFPDDQDVRSPDTTPPSSDVVSPRLYGAAAALELKENTRFFACNTLKLDNDLKEWWTSKSTLTLLGKSKLYLWLQKSKLPFEKQVFICEIAVLKAKVFLSPDTFLYEETFRLLASWDDQRNKDITKCISSITDTALWNDDNLSMVIGLGLESLPYLSQFTDTNLKFLGEVASKIDASSIRTILSHMSYSDLQFFSSLQGEKNKKHIIECFDYMWQSDENIQAVIRYIATVTALNNKAWFIPKCFIDMVIKIERIQHLWFKNYQWEKELKLKWEINKITSDPDWIALRDTNKWICEHYEKTQEIECSRVFACLEKIYTGVSKVKDVSQQANFARALSWLDFEIFERFSGQIGIQKISEICEDEPSTDKIQQFIVFLELHDSWEDIATSYSLFLESLHNSDTSQENIPTADIHTQISAVFWETIGEGIMNLWFPEALLHIFVHEWEKLEQWQALALWSWIILRANNLQAKYNKDSAKIIEKLWYVSEIIAWGDWIWINTQKHSLELFPCIVFWESTQEDIAKLTQTEIDIGENYATIYTAIENFLKNGNYEKFCQQVWISSEV